MRERLDRKGISEAVALILALIATIAVASLAVLFFLFHSQAVGAVVQQGIGEQLARMGERVSMVYWIGDRLMLKNEGEAPVTIRRIFTDTGVREFSDGITISPGEKRLITQVLGSDLLVIQTSSGRLIKLKAESGSSGSGGGGVEARLEIIESSIERTGASNNIKIVITVKNTGSMTVHSVSVVYIGETGETHVEPRNWLLSPGQTAQHTVCLPEDVYGDSFYVRVVGYTLQGGVEVSDAVWLTLEE